MAQGQTHSQKIQWSLNNTKLVAAQMTFKCNPSLTFVDAGSHEDFTLFLGIEHCGSLVSTESKYCKIVAELLHVLRRDKVKFTKKWM